MDLLTHRLSISTSTLLIFLVACGPGPGGSGTDSDSGGDTSSTSSTTAPTTSASTTTDTTTTTTDTTTTTTTDSTATVTDSDDSEGTFTPPEPGVPLDQFTCSGAKWLYIHPTVSGAGPSLVASDGRFVVSNNDQLHVFDADGALVGGFDHGDVTWGWGGIDGLDHLYFTFIEGRPEHVWLRKFDLAGALVWEVDRGPGEEFGGRVVVAPDGASLVSRRFSNRIERFAADGAPTSDRQLPAGIFDEVWGTNNSGHAVALRYGEDGAVVVLGADDEVVWHKPLELPSRGWADIDESGAVVVAAAGSLQVRRFIPDGVLSWTLALDLGEVDDGTASAIAMNEAGKVAVSAWASEGEQHRAFAVEIDPEGFVIATRACDPYSEASAVAVDEAGTVYLAGTVYAEDGGHLFAAAF